MGDTSIIAKRLKNGHVQYGWSGNNPGGNQRRRTALKLQTI